jgi:DNA-binding MarR family transcriptional regulator
MSRQPRRFASKPAANPAFFGVMLVSGRPYPAWYRSRIRGDAIEMPIKTTQTDANAALDADRPIDLGVLPDLIGYHLRKAQIAVFQDYARSVGSGEISPGQFSVLTVIDCNPGLSQARLGQILGIDRSTLVAVIDRLEARGLVERTDAPRDRRSYALYISGQGRKLVADLTERVRAHERHIAADLDEAEKASLIALLRRVGPPA